MAKSPNKPTKKAVKPVVNAEKSAEIPAKTVRSAKKARNSAAAGASKNPRKTGKINRHPKGKRPTKAEELKITERRYLVWDLYKAGASYRAISEHLKIKGFASTSLGTVHSDLQFCLSLQHNNLELDIKDHVENEVAIINDVQLSFFSLMKDTRFPLDNRLDAGSMILNCVKERARLRNLYKPKEIRILTEADFAKALGIAPEELPDDEPSGD